MSSTRGSEAPARGAVRDAVHDAAHDHEAAREATARAAGARSAGAGPLVRLVEDADGDAAAPEPQPCAELETLVHRQLELLGEDPDRDGLLKTPARVARSLAWLTRGYEMSAREVIGDALFEVASESMVMVRDIELYSLCEHHMLPFYGKAHIAYLPAGRVVGISKLARVVEVYARRLQVQERLTEQIAQALEEVLQPQGVGVVIEAAHLCMMMRGVEKQNSRTVTSALRGKFRDCPMTRDEFLRLAHGPSGWSR